MAQTLYNAPVAYNAPIRYDGITADVTPDEPTIGFDPPRKRRTEPVRRFITVTHTTTPVWVVVSQADLTDEDLDLVLLDLL